MEKEARIAAKLYLFVEDSVHTLSFAVRNESETARDWGEGKCIASQPRIVFDERKQDGRRRA